MDLVVDAYADVGWSATAISLSLARIEQERAISRDRATLQAVAGALDSFSQGAYEQEETETPLFSQIEGLFVFVRTMSEWHQPPAEGDIRQRAGSLAAMVRDFLGTGRQGEPLRKFFRKVHDVAEEVTATRLPFDPVVEVFGALAESRRTASCG